tara:strand:+ start:3568 stop:3849 length:282 start_codon:yes stop_codon:yes gene_type:complete
MIIYVGEVVSDDGLHKVKWRFTDIGAIIYLDSMTVCCRETRRHGWKSIPRDSYSRLNNRNNGVKTEPEVPFDIQVDAVEHYQKQITFRMWKDL